MTGARGVQWVSEPVNAEHINLMLILVLMPRGGEPLRSDPPVYDLWPNQGI